MAIGSRYAEIGRIFYDVLTDAEQDEMEDLLRFASDETAEHAFSFMEMLIRFADQGRCIVFDNLPEWGQTYCRTHGSHWNDGQKRRFNFLMNQYRMTIEKCPGMEQSPFDGVLPVFADSDFEEFFRGVDEGGATGSDGEDVEGADETLGDGLGV